MTVVVEALKNLTHFAQWCPADLGRPPHHLVCVSCLHPSQETYALMNVMFSAMEEDALKNLTLQLIE